MHMQPWYKCPNQPHYKRSGILMESNSFYSTSFIQWHSQACLQLLPNGRDEILDYKFSNSINCSLISKSGRYMMLPFSWQVKDEI